MRVSIHTLGTRGDVQPYLALALGLQARGHEVRLAAPEPFASLVSPRGVAFIPLPGEFLALLDSPEGKAAVAGGRGIGAGLTLLKHARPLMRRLLDDEWAAARGFGPDILVHHPKSLAAPHIAERLGIPAVLASPLPGFTPTAAFPSPLLPAASLGPLNRVSHQLALRGGDVLFGRTLSAWRRDALGLEGRRARLRSRPVLYAYSRHVVPVPPDWGEDMLVSGYWFLDGPTGWQPPADMARFLASGDAPVYAGFGSMPGLDPDRLARLVVEALARAGRRGLLATGGGALAPSDVPSHVHVVSAAPHDRLFPHVAAALHHGGAGTTGASLRAGLPTIVCPFFGDQPFWGRRVAALGAGPAPLDRRRLTVEVLAAAFRATANPAMRRRAGEVGARIAGEDGVAAAVTFLERQARRAHAA